MRRHTQRPRNQLAGPSAPTNMRGCEKVPAVDWDRGVARDHCPPSTGDEAGILFFGSVAFDTEALWHKGKIRAPQGTYAVAAIRGPRSILLPEQANNDRVAVYPKSARYDGQSVLLEEDD